MTTCFPCLSVAFGFLMLVVQPAMSEVSVDQVKTCLSERMSTGQSPATCIDDAQSECLAVDNEAPAVATLCFVDAEKDWNGGISSLMAHISKVATDEIAAIAGIEAKYDLLSALLQCSRMEELSLAVGRDNEPAILRQNARCKANAAGLTFARLYLRSQDLR
ncbi:hypothetical protein [Marivita sp.]|uniref:hypothetical protein n=1 Tax=Marivita sp. TaxID=2003365 RepID=UPI003F6C4A2F